MLLLEPTGQPPKFNLVNYQADTSFRTLEGYTVYIYTYIYIIYIHIKPSSSLRQTDCSLILLHHVVPGPVARRRVFLLQEIFRPQETVEKHVQPAPVRSVEFVPEKDIHLSIVHLYLLRWNANSLYSDAVEAWFIKNIKRLMLSMPIFLGFCKSVSAWFRFSKVRHFVIGLPAARPRVSQWSKPSKSLHRVQHNDASRHPVAYGTAVHSVTVDWCRLGVFKTEFLPRFSCYTWMNVIPPGGPRIVHDPIHR